jgi:hypothetical protein
MQNETNMKYLMIRVRKSLRLNHESQSMAIAAWNWISSLPYGQKFPANERSS